MREGRWKWWRDQGSQSKRSLHAWMRWDKHSDILSHAMCARNECDNTRLRRLTTTRTLTCHPSVSRHWWVSCASCWRFSGSWFSRCHWCRTSHRSTSFHHAYAILQVQSSFFWIVLSSSTQSVSQTLAHFTSRKRVFWGVDFTPSVGYSRPPSTANDLSVTK